MVRNVAIWNSWKATLLALLSLCSFNIDYLNAEGNIGCLFIESICLDNVEWCFDDYAFGKCLPKYGYGKEETERAPLNEEQSHILSTMLEELQGAGLGWDHQFVQCRMQGALFSIRNSVPMPPNLCATLAPDPQILDPHSPLAFVRFSPPNDDYADEVYYPPEKKGFDDRLYVEPIKTIQPPEKLTSEKTIRNPYIQYGPVVRVAYDGDSDFPDDDNEIEEDNLVNKMKDMKNRIELRRMLAQYEAGHLKPPIYYRGSGLEESSAENDDDSAVGIQNNGPFSHNYKRTGSHSAKSHGDHDGELPLNNMPRTSFREIEREYHNPASGKEVRLHEFEETNELPLEPLKFRSNGAGNSNELKTESGVYTEGGLVLVPDTDSDSHSLERKLEATNLLANMLGFTRHERLDVKKPGPPAAPPPSAQSDLDTRSKLSDVNKEVVPYHIKGGLLPKIKKVLHTDEDHGPHSVDTDFTHVILKTPIENWTDGPRIVAALADTLNMQNFFTFSRVDRHEISFRVEPNPEKKTAADIARAINDSRFKNNLSRRYGVVVVRAGVGDKTKEPLSVSISKVETATEGPDVTHVMAYMFAGAGAAAVVVIVITLFLIRRHDQKRDKLGGLQAGLAGTESSSKDYQELCRARMAGKGNTNDTASSGRIASICKENDKPPSSRSSTSSWSEEPAITNMDISTGHMVLSYMEDHLRNKGRLQREWEALCRYEAEPSSRDAAMQPQCESLNRSTAPLPFDHSRLVINHLTNAEGLDYINASTITDHDPRAPAYVAAQGPLPSTLAHFWQMIWEQGSVVIVSLCRLQENGEIACARYWPEEGSEVYHIYEVHLVSEHIWCDDYLVRSFYLKNLRTSETRTVTQFHFLSWPPAGVPVAAKALLEFRRKVNKSYRGRSCPIVVHSSNGAGRTGAYILLDLVLARMNKGAREIDIAATLEHLRDQRAGLVATRQQFEFVLMAVAEEVHAILKALPANSQPEKRELDNDTVKEQQATTEKEKDKDKDKENGKDKQQEKDTVAATASNKKTAEGKMNTDTTENK